MKACLEELESRPSASHPGHPRADLAGEERARLTRGLRRRVASFWDQTVAETYDLYQRRLHASNAVDFDDLLMLTVQVLSASRSARALAQ